MAVYPHPAAQGGFGGRLARKVGHIAPLYLFVIFYAAEGRTADRPACLLRSVGRSLRVTSPAASGDRPQRELEAVPCVVSR
jgi:hypothetical protein